MSALLDLVGHILKKLIDQFWPDSKKNAKTEEKSGIYEQVHRFKRVLIAHDIEPAYWPDFFETSKAPFSIRHADLKSDDSLLEWLDNTKVSWLCQTFLIDRDWMNGAGHGPHQRYIFGANPKRLVEAVKDESGNYPVDGSHHSDAVFLLNSHSEKALSDPCTRVAIAYGIPICQLGNEVLVTRWIVDDGGGGYPWKDEKYQPYIRIYARLAHMALGMHTIWRLLRTEDFDAFLNGDLLFPEALEKATRFRADTHPEDFGMLESESAMAKAAESLPPILERMRTDGLPVSTPEPKPALAKSKDVIDDEQNR